MTFGNWFTIAVMGGGVILLAGALLLNEWWVRHVGVWVKAPRIREHTCRLPKHLRWHSPQDRWQCAGCKTFWRLDLVASSNPDMNGRLRWVEDTDEEVPSSQKEAHDAES